MNYEEQNGFLPAGNKMRKILNFDTFCDYIREVQVKSEYPEGPEGTGFDDNITAIKEEQLTVINLLGFRKLKMITVTQP